MQTNRRPSARAFIQRHAVVIFYVLVFALAFGPALVLGGPGVFTDSGRFSRTGEEVATAADLGPVMLVSAVAGPPIYALLAVVVVAVAFGRDGLRDLRARVFRGRAPVRWYALALFTAPILWLVIQGALSLTSSAYVPGIVTAEDKTALLATALVAALVAAFFEEIAWTGFATHELLKRHGAAAAGIMVGLLWCLLHLPLVAVASSGDLPRELTVPVSLFAWPLPYRVLMVWAYSRTKSVPIVMLMHVPVSSLVLILGSAAMAGTPDLTFNLIFGATLWVLVAAVSAAARGTKPGWGGLQVSRRGTTRARPAR